METILSILQSPINILLILAGTAFIFLALFDLDKGIFKLRIGKIDFLPIVIGLIFIIGGFLYKPANPESTGIIEALLQQPLNTLLILSGFVFVFFASFEIHDGNVILQKGDIRRKLTPVFIGVTLILTGILYKADATLAIRVIQASVLIIIILLFLIYLIISIVQLQESTEEQDKRKTSIELTKDVQQRITKLATGNLPNDVYSKYLVDLSIIESELNIKFADILLKITEIENRFPKDVTLDTIASINDALLETGLENIKEEIKQLKDKAITKWDVAYIVIQVIGVLITLLGISLAIINFVAGK